MNGCPPNADPAWWPGRMLVVYGKRDTERWPASTVAELDASAKSVLRERFTSGYWYEAPDEPNPDVVADAALTDEQIAALPGHWKDVALTRRGEARCLMAAHRHETAAYAALIEADAAVSTIEDRPGGQGSRAWDVLRARRGYEYERVELETAGADD